MITALVLLAGFLCVLFLLPKSAVAMTFGLVAALMGWEWAALARLGRIGRGLFVVAVIASCLAAYANAVATYPLFWWVSAAFWIFLAPVLLWRKWRISGNSIAGWMVGWILIVPTWAALVAIHSIEPWLLFAAMGLVWIADIAAYFAGRAWGRHKLAPAISPGKTWEGVAGALAGVLLYGLAATHIAAYSPPAWPAWLLLLVALTVVSVMGDLLESLVKRQAGVKDSGAILPGHGGLLDRLDSQTSTLPLAALILTSITRP